MKAVLLPGMDGTGEMFRPLTDKLPEKIEPIIISYPLDKVMDYEELVSYVIDRLPEEDFVLVAESFSGYIAYQIALKENKNLKKVIFVASFLDKPSKYWLALASFVPLKWLLKITVPDWICKKMLFGIKVDKSLISMFNETIKMIKPEVLISRINLMKQLKKADIKSSIPVVYIKASKDRLIRKESVKDFERVFEKLDVEKVEGGHLITQVNPSDCAKIIAKSIHGLTY